MFPGYFRPFRGLFAGLSGHSQVSLGNADSGHTNLKDLRGTPLREAICLPCHDLLNKSSEV